ncbi:MAG: hypothetical protein HY557_06175 [Euryarchaeota archaeon]|nr:hypothetical protein [Euryarchaeota archaeon]
MNAPVPITHAFAAAFERARELPDNAPPPDLPGPVVNPRPIDRVPSAPHRPPGREQRGREP